MPGYDPLARSILNSGGTNFSALVLNKKKVRRFLPSRTGLIFFVHNPYDTDYEDSDGSIDEDDDEERSDDEEECDLDDDDIDHDGDEKDDSGDDNDDDNDDTDSNDDDDHNDSVEGL